VTLSGLSMISIIGEGNESVDNAHGHSAFPLLQLRPEFLRSITERPAPSSTRSDLHKNFVDM
jgi:hypothetical protein